jgi:hypothetical protein
VSGFADYERYDALGLAELVRRRRDGSELSVLLTIVRLQVGGETFVEGQLIDMSGPRTAATPERRAAPATEATLRRRGSVSSRPAP